MQWSSAEGGRSRLEVQWCCLEGSDRPYEGMNIAGVTGITEAQKATLKMLGAVDQAN